jgi:hypothetical protein
VLSITIASSIGLGQLSVAVATFVLQLVRKILICMHHHLLMIGVFAYECQHRMLVAVFAMSHADYCVSNIVRIVLDHNDPCAWIHYYREL